MSLLSQLSFAMSSADIRRTLLVASMIIEDTSTNSEELKAACQAMASAAKAGGHSAQQIAWEMAAKGVPTSGLSSLCGSVGEAAASRLR